MNVVWSRLALSPETGPVAPRLRGLRRAAGLTQAELARVLGVTRRYVVQVESGHRVPRPLLLDGWFEVCAAQRPGEGT